MDGAPQSKRAKTNGQQNGDSYMRYEEGSDEDFVVGTSICFTTTIDNVGVPLKIIKSAGIKMTNMESRPSKSDPSKHDFLVGIDDSLNLESVCDKIMENLKPVVQNVIKHGGEKVPWFPKCIGDLDKFADRVLNCGSELDADHPGFKDPVYRERRKEFADIAINYKHYQELPNVEYTQEEVKTWGTIFSTLKALFPTHACKELNDVWPDLIEQCDYREDTVPQLRKVSKFLKNKTGFTLRPVAGLLSSRDFLAGLAFRVFHSTQYIRHSSVPMYTPEPDVCHELIGHVPLFADPEFARFSQEIGLLSLGISDDWIQKLATLYWFTVEFGLCRQQGKIKAYGAGLLSSFGELQYCIESDECERRNFEPDKACVQEYPITKFQPIYFVANSFEDAKEKLKSWAAHIPCPVTVHYNPYTQTVEVIDKKEQVAGILGDLKAQADNLQVIVKKMN